MACWSAWDLVLDVAKNAHVRSDQDIAAPESKVRVLVLVVRAQVDWHRARMLEAVIATNSGFLELEIQAIIRNANLFCQISNFNA
jgi:hypothetical protein